MEDTDWFAEREQEQQERCYWRRVGFSLFAALALALLMVPMMTGCASNEPQICYMGLLGQTEEGYSVVAQQCMSQEAFKELQKKK